MMKNKRSWWSLKIHDYPNYDPNDSDLEHIAECIRQGYDQGELIQDEEKQILGQVVCKRHLVRRLAKLEPRSNVKVVFATVGSGVKFIAKLELTSCAHAIRMD